MSQSPSTVAELIRRHRTDMRLSQSELADRAGLNPHEVRDIETGVARSPRALTLALLGEALHLDRKERERLRSATPPRSNVTPRRPKVPKLIGRRKEITAALRLLQSEHVRLLTFIGPAGVGKTSLALAVVNEALAERDGKAIFIDLAPLSDMTFVTTKIALALGLRDVPGQNTRETLAAELRKRSLLLVLDGCEHQAAAASFIAELLGAAPLLKILATSRTPLGFEGEHAIAVTPLAVPRANPARRVRALARVPSVRLLIARAKAAQPDFALTSENADGVADLAAALEGLPLAIELAAPRLKVFSPTELTARLERRLPLGDDRAEPSASRSTTRATVAWSYELLPAAGRRLLRRLSVLHGRFTAEAALAIASDAEGDADLLDVLRLLAKLEDRGFVQVEDRAGEPRFELAAPVREFASEQLVAAGESDSAGARLADRALSVAQLVSFAQPQSQRRELLDRLEEEAANFDASLAWARAGGRIELGLRLALALWAFWWLRGSAADGLSWLRALLDAAERSAEPVPEGVLADAYYEAAGLAEARGALDDADRFGSKALELKRRSGDLRAVAGLISGRGVVASQRGDYAEARRLLAESLRLRRELGEVFAIGAALCDLGQNATNEGDGTAAIAFLEESQVHFRGAQSELGIGAALAVLGLVHARAGNDDQAEACGRESLKVAENVGQSAAIALAKYDLGRVALGRDAFGEADAFFSDALSGYESLEDSAGSADVGEALAAVRYASGRTREAARLLGAAAALRDRARAHIVPAERGAHEQLVADVAAALGPERFASEWNVGHDRSMRETLAAENVSMTAE